ncbi:MAG: ferric reductase-like transmembrane domain-containing protein [Chromatiales bacterium]|jgi:predicted ferric reductase|nr:ferric reductase-like transmembrane domain-containing protein [Chromatiales bacterium]
MKAGVGLPGAVLASLYVGLASLPMLVGHLSGIEPLRPLGEFATALGLTTAALLHLQFLSSGRYEQLSGRIGIDRTMGFHRLAAGTLLVFAILHPLGYATASASGDPVMAWNRLLKLLMSARLRTGVFALAGLVVIVVLAVLRTRPWVRYELWRVSHGPLAILVTVLSLDHAVVNGAYTGEMPLRLVWVVLALMAGTAVVIAYVLRPLRMWREGWVIERVSRIGARTVEMILRGPVGTALRFRAGQFIWLSIAPNRPPFHDHPFSIASAPAELPLLRLLVGEVGNCTRHFAELAPGTGVAIDGPHGSFVLPPGDGPVLLVAGGAGIAPMVGILADAAAQNDRRPFRLLYAARSQKAVVDAERLDALRARLDLSISFLLREGPLDMPHIRELLAGIRPDTAVAMLCGPARMMEIAADALLAAGMLPDAIHYERFDLAAGHGQLDHRRLRQALSVFLALLVLMGLFSVRGP